MNISKLYACIDAKKVNTSQAREAIYTLLMQEGGCITVAEISKKLSTSYPRKVSLNTIYRHLTLFTECELVMVIQDDQKKAYYCLCGNDAKAFNICPKCNNLAQIESEGDIYNLLKSLKSSEFLTIHKKCKKCI